MKSRSGLRYARINKPHLPNQRYRKPYKLSRLKETVYYKIVLWYTETMRNAGKKVYRKYWDILGLSREEFIQLYKPAYKTKKVISENSELLDKSYYIRNRIKILEQAKQKYLYIKKFQQEKYLVELEKKREGYRKESQGQKEQRRKREKLCRDRKRKNLLMLICGEKIECKKCSFPDIRALQIDHVKGGGNHEKKIIGKGFYNMYKKIISNSPNSYQVLCANCNWIKRCENREYGNYGGVNSVSKP